MSTPFFDDETVMAFADGEADAETTARIETALETDDELMARVAVFMESRAAAKSALAPMLQEPVPDALLASVHRMIEKRKTSADAAGQAERTVTPDEEKILPFRARTPLAAAPAKSNWRTALAASILVAVMAGGAGYLAGHSATPKPSLFGPVSPELAGVLETAASAGKGVAINGGTVTVVSSFRGGAGELCREYEITPRSGQGLASVACHLAGGWETRLALATAPHAPGYVPAGAQETIDAYLGSIGSGEPLSAEEEADALKLLQKGRE